jgi:hypothetical protein
MLGSVVRVVSLIPGYYVQISSLARGVIGNTPGFGPGIPSSSLGGPALFDIGRMVMIPKRLSNQLTAAHK